MTKMSQMTGSSFPLYKLRWNFIVYIKFPTKNIDIFMIDSGVLISVLISKGYNSFEVKLD